MAPVKAVDYMNRETHEAPLLTRSPTHFSKTTATRRPVSPLLPCSLK